MAGCIFLLLGKTHSHKRYVKERCKHIHVLNCVESWEINDEEVNVVVGGMSDYERIKDKHRCPVYPVFIHTSDEHVLRVGLDAVMHGQGTCHNLCSTFLQETKEYNDESLKDIGAYIIKEGARAIPIMLLCNT